MVGMRKTGGGEVCSHWSLLDLGGINESMDYGTTHRWKRGVILTGFIIDGGLFRLEFGTRLILLFRLKNLNTNDYSLELVIRIHKVIVPSRDNNIIILFVLMCALSLSLRKTDDLFLMEGSALGQSQQHY